MNHTRQIINVFQQPLVVARLCGVQPEGMCVNLLISTAWEDKERLVPLKEELYAKSGTLLKKTTMKDIEKIDGRWFPKQIHFKDMLKKGGGTEFIVEEIAFDQDIPNHIFSKASLRR